MGAPRTWSLSLTLALLASAAQAEELEWQAARPGPSAVSASPAAPSDRPFQIGVPTGADTSALATEPNGLGSIPGPRTIVRGQAAVPSVPPPSVPPPPPGSPPPFPASEEPFNCGVNTAPAPAHPLGGFWNGMNDCIKGVVHPGDGRCCLQSDHKFDDFISPVTSPFLSLDPRSLTEIRPIFMYQHTPGSAPHFDGGNIEFFGFQGSLALTERLSLVVNKVGWIWENMHSPSGDFHSANGLTEIWLGPQYTIIRNDCSGTLLAAGLTFQIPTGSSRVFQDTGTLSLMPYVSFGQRFLQTPFGSFHFMNTTGYAASIDGHRTDMFYSNFHLDYGIANKWYPFVELNYSVYTKNGNQEPINVGGRDLFNFGSTMVSGHNELTLATGLRYKPIEAIQFGVGIEFPLVSNKDLMQYRLTFDMIFRY
jgi:hypothetical protein